MSFSNTCLKDRWCSDTHWRSGGMEHRGERCATGVTSRKCWAKTPIQSIHREPWWRCSFFIVKNLAVLSIALLCNYIILIIIIIILNMNAFKRCETPALLWGESAELRHRYQASTASRITTWKVSSSLNDPGARCMGQTCFSPPHSLLVADHIPGKVLLMAPQSIDTHIQRFNGKPDPGRWCSL